MHPSCQTLNKQRPHLICQSANPTRNNFRVLTFEVLLNKASVIEHQLKNLIQSEDYETVFCKSQDCRSDEFDKFLNSNT